MTTEVNYEKRQIYVGNIERELMADRVGGMSALRQASEGASEELGRDLLAMAWRVGQGSENVALRAGLVEYLLDAGLANRSPFLRQQALRFLQDFPQQDFNGSARDKLAVASLQGDDAVPIIRLTGIVDLRAREPALRDIAADAASLEGNGLYGSRAWAASLALARMGDAASVEQVIVRVRAEPDIVVRATRLFADLAYTRQPAVLSVLRGYLDSNARLPTLKSTVPGEPESVSAARALANAIEGGPVPGADIGIADVPRIRAWFDAQNAAAPPGPRRRPGF